MPEDHGQPETTGEINVEESEETIELTPRQLRVLRYLARRHMRNARIMRRPRTDVVEGEAGAGDAGDASVPPPLSAAPAPTGVGKGVSTVGPVTPIPDTMAIPSVQQASPRPRIIAKLEPSTRPAVRGNELPIKPVVPDPQTPVPEPMLVRPHVVPDPQTPVPMAMRVV